MAVKAKPKPAAPPKGRRRGKMSFSRGREGIGKIVIIRTSEVARMTLTKSERKVGKIAAASSPRLRNVSEAKAFPIIKRRERRGTAKRKILWIRASPVVKRRGTWVGREPKDRRSAKVATAMTEREARKPLKTRGNLTKWGVALNRFFSLGIILFLPLG
jgi:hypothetical protein